MTYFNLVTGMTFISAKHIDIKRDYRFFYYNKNVTICKYLQYHAIVSFSDFENKCNYRFIYFFYWVNNLCKSIVIKTILIKKLANNLF